MKEKHLRKPPARPEIDRSDLATDGGHQGQFWIATRPQYRRTLLNPLALFHQEIDAEIVLRSGKKRGLICDAGLDDGTRKLEI
jgi:hypothetical protein